MPLNLLLDNWAIEAKQTWGVQGDQEPSVGQEGELLNQTPAAWCAHRPDQEAGRHVPKWGEGGAEWGREPQKEGRGRTEPETCSHQAADAEKAGTVDGYSWLPDKEVDRGSHVRQQTPSMVACAVYSLCVHVPLSSGKPTTGVLPQPTAGPLVDSHPYQRSSSKRTLELGVYGSTHRAPWPTSVNCQSYIHTYAHVSTR